MGNSAAPITESKRLVWIDAARGFAIFGIFMVNAGAFSSPYFLYGGENEVWPSEADRFMQILTDIFFQASFYTLFSILFGFGFQMMKDRLVARGTNVYPFYLRRMVILICFGAIHAFAIWHGDILLSYGIIGLFLLLFVKFRTRGLLITGVLLMGLSVSFITLSYYQLRDYLGIINQTAILQSMENFQSNNLFAIWSQNFQNWMVTNNVFSFVFLGMILLPLFLFGMVLAQKRWLHEPLKYKSILWKLWAISLVLFIALKIGPYVYGNPLWFSYIQDNAGGMFSALFYIISITFISQTEIGMKIIRPFTYVGRMALTNYILQSVICFLLFYGVGFGLYGSVRPMMIPIIVLPIYFLQILFSWWWFKRFRFGPLEWVWRSLTYMKPQKFRKAG